MFNEWKFEAITGQQEKGFYIFVTENMGFFFYHRPEQSREALLVTPLFIYIYIYIHIFIFIYIYMFLYIYIYKRTPLVATLSNCGNSLRASPTKLSWRQLNGQANDLGYGNNGDRLGNPQPSSLRECSSETRRQWVRLGFAFGKKRRLRKKKGGFRFPFLFLFLSLSLTSNTILLKI